MGLLQSGSPTGCWAWLGGRTPKPPSGQAPLEEPGGGRRKRAPCGRPAGSRWAGWLPLPLPLALAMAMTMTAGPGPGRAEEVAPAPVGIEGDGGRSGSEEALPETRLPAFHLIPDPVDVDAEGRPRPLGDRVPVVVVHGYSRLYVNLLELAASETWRPFRAALAEATGRDPASTAAMKVFYYHYRPVEPYPVLARQMAERLRDELLVRQGARRVVFLAHSAGTLMARYASAEPGFGDRVAGIVTLAGIHRGSVQASLVAARDLDRRPGVTREHLRLLDARRRGNGVDPRVWASDPGERIACRDDPACRVLESLAFDNFDGTITPEDIRDFGMIENTPLRTFNERDPRVGRIYAYHGDVSDLGEEPVPPPLLERVNLFGNREPAPREMRPTPDERERRAIEAVNPRWRNVDPIVHYASGTFAESHCELGACRTWPDLDHVSILRDPRVMAQVVRDLGTLAELARRGREDELPTELGKLWRASVAVVGELARPWSGLVPREPLRSLGLYGLGVE